MTESTSILRPAIALLLILPALACGSGGGSGAGGAREEGQPAREAPVEPPTERIEPPAPVRTSPREEAIEEGQADAPSAPELPTPESAAEKRRERVRRNFGKLIDPLTEASEAYRRHEELDESSWFGEDRSDNQKRIDELLDEAVRVLELGEVTTVRQEIRQLEAEIVELENSILRDREARLGAPSREELNRLQRTYTSSREELTERIAEAENEIDARRARIEALHQQFVAELRAIGVEISLEGARSLLSSVAGDDFIEMCVVFDNVRGVTVQLQELTEESGESLEAAKRYYGSYVVLIHLMDRIQRDFVRRVHEEMIPELQKYGREAEDLIEVARDNIRSGGNRTIGEQNIRSNELTMQATGLYIEYLRQQASEVQGTNEALQVDLRDAINTYDTVLLSSQVAELLKEGSKNFGALMNLDVPDLRGFENAELRAEFERLTERMTRID